VAFFMGLFAGLFQSSVYGTGDIDVIFVYEFIIKTLGCVLLACSANVLKTLFAKLLSNHFYRDSYFEKMQDALCKVSHNILTTHSNKPCHILLFSVPVGMTEWHTRPMRRRCCPKGF